MKKTYIIPHQRWAIMEENYLQSMSVKEDYADPEKEMESRGQGNWSEGGSSSNGGSLWNEW